MEVLKTNRETDTMGSKNLHCYGSTEDKQTDRQTIWPETTYVVMEAGFVRVHHAKILRHWRCRGGQRIADLRGGVGWLGVD